MNYMPPENLHLLVLCPMCGLRKALHAFIDPLNGSLVMCCRECRSQRVQYHPAIPSKPCYPIPVRKPASRSKKGSNVIPRAKWSAVKRSSQSKERVYKAKLVFHRTLH